MVGESLRWSHNVSETEIHPKSVAAYKLQRAQK
jgi:hypothetical protein